MNINETPKLDEDISETGCCPRFKPKEWDEQEFEFKDKLFVKAKTINFMHIPLNMGSVVKRTWEKVEQAGADSYGFILLSTDPSPWRGEHYFSVTKEVPGADNVKLSGKYITKVFEGPYKDARKWVDQMKKYVGSKNKDMKQLYFYYSTCPKCAKHYGENYVVGFAQV